jgi:hypothetical protein
MAPEKKEVSLKKISPKEKLPRPGKEGAMFPTCANTLEQEARTASTSARQSKQRLHLSKLPMRLQDKPRQLMHILRALSLQVELQDDSTQSRQKA